MSADKRGHLTVVYPGFLTTIQDLGRVGYQQYGVPVSGVMDWLATRVANQLVGNSPREALLEITLGSFSCVFDHRTWVAITGGDVQITVGDTVSYPLWQALLVNEGETLRLERGTGRRGGRTYLAVAGGLAVSEVLGSRSTFLAAEMGGWPRALRKGDQIPVGRPNSLPPVLRLPPDLCTYYASERAVRIVLGPQSDRFTSGALTTLLGSTYVVTPQSDRTGYRLSGPKIEHVQTADIISDPIALGSIQVPGSGLPVVLMADHRVTGGYAKIATVISADIPYMAQQLPGKAVQFDSVTSDQAACIRRQLQDRLLAAGLH